jgi:hypothetical protein
MNGHFQKSEERIPGRSGRKVAAQRRGGGDAERNRRRKKEMHRKKRTQEWRDAESKRGMREGEKEAIYGEGKKNGTKK